MAEPGGQLESVRDVLTCPVCARELTVTAQALRCAAGHSFDVARQGYVSLLPGAHQAGSGDTSEMVSARTRFLGRGHYAPISEALSDTVLATGLPAGSVVAELAGGTGYYLAAVLDHAPPLRGVTLDLSRYAARRATRAHPRLASVRADVWQPLPLRAGSCAAVLSVFGPRNPAEIARVLRPGAGRLVVVTPGSDHLAELVAPLGLLAVDPVKDRRLTTQLAEFEVVARRDLSYPVAMTHEDARDVALMSPSAHHLAAADLSERVAALPESGAVTVSVSVRSYALG